MEHIGYIKTDFHEKFGIPRQGNLIEELKGTIVMKGRYNNLDAFRGIEEFSHLWILWEFSMNVEKESKLLVTPPRLGGKEKKGVFATRAPFRPNHIGMSCVRLLGIRKDDKGNVLVDVAGVDMLDNTPVYDIKPYIPYTDCRNEAMGGYTTKTIIHHLEVEFENKVIDKLPLDKKNAVIKILELDPRPTYDTDKDSNYGIEYAGYDIRFRVDEEENKLIVYDIVKRDEQFLRIK